MKANIMRYKNLILYQELDFFKQALSLPRLRISQIVP